MDQWSYDYDQSTLFSYILYMVCCLRVEVGGDGEPTGYRRRPCSVDSELEVTSGASE